MNRRPAYCAGANLRDCSWAMQKTNPRAPCFFLCFKKGETMKRKPIIPAPQTHRDRKKEADRMACRTKARIEEEVAVEKTTVTNIIDTEEIETVISSVDRNGHEMFMALIVESGRHLKVVFKKFPDALRKWSGPDGVFETIYQSESGWRFFSCHVPDIVIEERTIWLPGDIVSNDNFPTIIDLKDVEGYHGDSIDFIKEIQNAFWDFSKFVEENFEMEV